MLILLLCLLIFISPAPLVLPIVGSTGSAQKARPERSSLYFPGPERQAESSSPALPRLIMQQAPPDPQAMEQGRNMRVAIFLIISIITSSLSLGIAFGIRKRIDQIGGPIDDEDD